MKKDLKGCGCGLIKILSGICLEDLRETMEKTSTRIADVPH
jgi:hypothetical protein